MVDEKVAIGRVCHLVCQMSLHLGTAKVPVCILEIQRRQL